MDDFDGSGNFVTPYETAYLATEGDSKIFKKLNVKTDKQGSQIYISDEAGNTRRVMTEKTGLFNLMAREYTYEESEKSSAKHIHNSSSAVIHLIDGPLLIKN
jgi:hypothetical protein